jgi:hypothetical protein
LIGGRTEDLVPQTDRSPGLWPIFNGSRLRFLALRTNWRRLIELILRRFGDARFVFAAFALLTNLVRFAVPVWSFAPPVRRFACFISSFSPLV